MLKTMKDNNLKKLTVDGLIWGSVSNTTQQILGLIFGVFTARILTKSDYGMIGMLTIFTAIASSLQDSGFVSALTNKKDATHKDYNSVFWFNISMGLCLYSIFFLCAPLISNFYNEPLLTSLFRYYSLGFVAASFSIVPRAILFKQMRQKELAIMTIIAITLSGSIGVIMAMAGMAYWGLATQTICYTAIISVVSWIMSGWKPSRLFSVQPIKEMIGFSCKMLLTGIFGIINQNIFSVVLGKFYTKSEVGLYNQANKWNLMGVSTINGMVQGVAQPAFVQVGNDKERLCRVFSKMLRFTCFISFPAMFGLALVAPEFIVILLTDKWLPSAELMRILCIGGAFIPIGTLHHNIIISKGKSNIYMWNTIAQGIFILMSILLIHYFGGNINTMVKVYVSIIILWIGIWYYFVWKEIHFGIWQLFRDILPFLIISSVTMITTYYVTITINNIYLLLALRIVIATVLYCAISWVCGAKIMRECVEYIIKGRRK